MLSTLSLAGPGLRHLCLKMDVSDSILLPALKDLSLAQQLTTLELPCCNLQKLLLVVAEHAPNLTALKVVPSGVHASRYPSGEKLMSAVGKGVQLKLLKRLYIDNTQLELTLSALHGLLAFMPSLEELSAGNGIVIAFGTVRPGYADVSATCIPRAQLAWRRLCSISTSSIQITLAAGEVEQAVAVIAPAADTPSMGTACKNVSSMVAWLPLDRTLTEDYASKGWGASGALEPGSPFATAGATFIHDALATVPWQSAAQLFKALPHLSELHAHMHPSRAPAFQADNGQRSFQDVADKFHEFVRCFKRLYCVGLHFARKTISYGPDQLVQGWVSLLANAHPELSVLGVLLQPGGALATGRGATVAAVGSGSYIFTVSGSGRMQRLALECSAYMEPPFAGDDFSDEESVPSLEGSGDDDVLPGLLEEDFEDDGWPPVDDDSDDGNGMMPLLLDDDQVGEDQGML